MKTLLAVLSLAFASQSFANCYQAINEVPAYVPKKVCIEKNVANKTVVLVSEELGKEALSTTKTLYMTSSQYYILSEGVIYSEHENESCGRELRLAARFSGFVENNQLKEEASTFEITESFLRDTCHGREKFTNYKYQQI